MRRAEFASLKIPVPLVRDARLYSGVQDDTDAVCRVLSDYGRLVAEVRQLRRRVAQLDQEGAELDSLVDRLRFIAAQIDDL